MGTLGIFVPGLPTTVFLLLASYFFARSSPRLHRRLIEHPRLGPYLKLAQGRAMPLRAKLISLGAMWGGIVMSLLVLADANPAVRLAVIGLGLIGTAVLLFYVRTVGDDTVSAVHPSPHRP
jgi:uncharacterized membrane protein YbaN (DUF454 family)